MLLSLLDIAVEHLKWHGSSPKGAWLIISCALRAIFIACLSIRKIFLGEQSVWVRGGGSASAQFSQHSCWWRATCGAIFHGKDKQIPFTEQVKYDRISCIKNCWKPSCSGPIHLVLDVHRAQKTEEIQDTFKAERNTSITYVPGGCTSLVRPVDELFNKPFRVQ